MSSPIAQLFDQGRPITVQDGQSLFRTGDTVRAMYLVVAGRVDLVRHTPNGARLILARVGSGAVLAEASAYSPAYHCDGMASLPTKLRALPLTAFHDLLNGSGDLARAWAAQLAGTLQKARMQSEIRTLKTVSERLDAWLIDNPDLPPKGQIQDLAHILGVSREALYRELAKRR